MRSTVTPDSCVVAAGVSWPTLRKWVKRFEQHGVDGLQSHSRQPHRSPKAKLRAEDRELILELRKEAFGARRIQNELRLHHDIGFSLSTIHKVLKAADVAPLQRPRRTAESITRYSRPVPGDRLQMDTMKVAPGVYQYTAIDDCSRFRVLGVYRHRDAASTLQFLDRVIEEMPFAIQRIQTDRGLEFFAQSVQLRLADECIKFRPIAPRSPHLNGKVERSQLTDRTEFWTRHDPKDAQIEQRIEQWQFDYNWRRPHGALSGKTPAGHIASLTVQQPLREDVALAYDISKERLRFSALRVDEAMAVAEKLNQQRKTKTATPSHTEPELPTAARVRVRRKRPTRAAVDNSIKN